MAWMELGYNLKTVGAPFSSAGVVSVVSWKIRQKLELKILWFTCSYFIHLKSSSCCPENILFMIEVT